MVGDFCVGKCHQFSSIQLCNVYFGAESIGLLYRRMQFAQITDCGFSAENDSTSAGVQRTGFREGGIGVTALISTIFNVQFFEQSFYNALDGVEIHAITIHAERKAVGFLRQGVRPGYQVFLAQFIQRNSMISVFPLHAEEKALPAIAEFLTRANYEINLGCFDMDFEDGEIRYKMAQFCGATVPTYEQIQKIFYVAITTINHYGNGIAKTLLSLGTPKENLAECHQEPKKQ